jgi:RNA polymerase sigma-70 factor (ECF subfamily)
MPPASTLTVGGMDFESAYRTHFPAVWRSLRRFGVSEKDAQDVTQEVFLIACRRFEEFEGRSSLRTWLIGIAYGLAANYRRHSGRREVPDAPGIAGARSGLDFERQLERRDDLRRLEEVLASLPFEQRAVFTMFEMEGLSGDEIADALEVPVGTVRSRLRLAREAFGRAVQSEEAAGRWRPCGEES